MNNNNLIRRYLIIGERRLSNYWWATVVLLGAVGFLLTGIKSYLSSNLSLHATMEVKNIFLKLLGSSINSLPLSLTEISNSQISFFPQGLLMCFYGSLGFLLSLYWWFLIFWNVGGGFNEFNKKEGFIRIFRWGYPGQNRKIDLYYTLKDVESIRVELKQGGFADSQRTIYLKLKAKKEIPLTGIGEPLTIQEIEKQASELANFLQVSLEGL
jgi:hypothetical protein|uniref:hypothetical chloroplast RF4 n=1 Tax=Monoraphidium dybowskii TaxID=81818 RepID=UPI002238EDCD|nr:hypothetical chloroplast RF4 [Monoraphidium dybowskii]UYR96183.1 hypothetical chloroplast RF4 [Monoraphidium dybowskii]WDE21114.1 hypothetical protein RF4 [Chlorolobion braunii]